MTAGLKTSEFWLTLAGIVASTVLCFAGKIDASLWAAVVAGGSGAYSISRGLAKKQ